VDDFERPNPLSIYQTWRGDDSVVDSVSSAEFKKQGNYSMQISYTLVTSRSLPSWVSVSFQPERAMDWTLGKEIEFWLKGDGSRNILEVKLYDEKNQVWTAKVDAALKDVKWHQISLSFNKFLDPSGKNRLIAGLITKYEIAIVGEDSRVSSGRIWIDQLTLTGDNLNPLIVAPRIAVPQEKIDKTKINFGDFVHLEYRQTPEKNSEFLFFNSLYIRGTSKKLSITVDLVSEQNEAGSSIGFRTPLETGETDLASPTEVVEKRNPIQLAFIAATMHKIHPNLTQMTVGNVSIDYGRDIFSPVFGFKGIEAEGFFTPLHYDAFVIKHAFDGNTLGFRFQSELYDTLGKFIMVRHRDTARSLANAQIQNGQLVIPSDSDLETETVGDDTAFLFELDRTFLNKFNVSATYGLDYFNRNAVKDVSDPFNPKVESRLNNPVSLYGRMWQLRLKLLPGLLNRGLTFIASYRDFGSEFKPRFRFDPGFYDDFIADQRGTRFEMTQIIGKLKFNGLYDDVNRGTPASGYFRRFFRGSMGYYGWNKTDIVFSYNRRREFYALGENHLRSTFIINPLDPRNEKSDTFELFLGNWFSSSFYIWTKFRSETIKLINTSRKLRNDAIQIQGEVAISNNAKFILSVIQTRFQDKTAEPFGGDPPTDNVVRIILDVNF